jgi:hypothetical protein
MDLERAAMRQPLRVIVGNQLRGYPETPQQRHAYIKQHRCSNERQADRIERVYSA